jgi:lipopolysaccharide/colanic/teichoic acid biosynthesis glycosyltransferase
VKTTMPLTSLNGRSHGHPEPSKAGGIPLGSREILAREPFIKMLYLERKRAERSGRSFILMLLECNRLLHAKNGSGAVEKLLNALAGSTRDTDITGWYKDGSVVGVIFTELGPSVEGKAIVNALLSKVTNALSTTLSIKQINHIDISFHVFPEDWNDEGPSGGIDASLYDDFLHGTTPRRVSLVVKRLIDIIGSVLALMLASPLIAAIAILIKLTSKGPVFFRQARLGQYGRKFTFLKFRSMHFNSDPTIHREFVQKFIAGDGCAHAGNQISYKLTVDPRITPVGRFLRKTSLDEVPQFFNVLKGDMSLVGPRPPLPYEAARYKMWHTARLLAAKPGITGLWQVEGRSRVKFNDMVRLDLRYAQTWSIWLDIKILLRTPVAVFTADGAL